MSSLTNGILKPCPFCGRDVTIRWNGYYQAPIIRHIGKARFCLMDHKVYYGYQVEDIEKMWNERSKDAYSNCTN